ncbi:MAG: hypothetical protein Fur0020_08360 [Thermodesulfovibrionia bacterium]
MALPGRSLLIFIFTLCIGFNAYSHALNDVYEEHELLKSELRLAKTKNLYFVFDLRDKRVLIKATGVSLKEMGIEGVRFWGMPLGSGVYILLKKSALMEPKRERIEPKKEEGDDGKFEIKALELSDMPKRYRLTLSRQTEQDRGDVLITIRPAANGIVSNISSTLSLVGWYITRPIFTIWYHLKGRTFTSIYLTLQEEDARSIYWSFTEGAECLIYNP